MPTTDSLKLRGLVLGSGGREHALCWKLSSSPCLEKLYALPGNPGIKELGAELLSGSVTDFQEVKKAVLANGIQLVVVGAEAPLCAGIVDFFQNDPQLADVRIFGPTRQCAQLEASKQFAKDFMQRHNIPTARYQAFTSDQLEAACRFLDEMRPPYVIKADGLAAGKGVLIEAERANAEAAIRDCFAGKFGEAGKTVVIEQFLQGIEFSLFAICDGEHYEILPIAKDYKRAFDNDLGLNTGGMGSVTPVPFITSELRKRVENQIVRPTIEGMLHDKMPYTGFLFVGLMLTPEGDPYVIEYNVRMGDPETQVVMLALEGDLLAALYRACNHALTEKTLCVSPKTFVSVSLVSQGYPEAYETKKLVSGANDKMEGVTLFHAGTALNAQGRLITSGGRVFSVCGSGNNIEEARERAYAMAQHIQFEGKRCRSDIGMDLI